MGYYSQQLLHYIAIQSSTESGKQVKMHLVFIMGLINVPLKVAKMSNGLVLTSALASIGFVAGITPTAALKTGIINISTLIPAASLILCGLLILFGFRLTEDKIEQMQREINTRKQEITA